MSNTTATATKNALDSAILFCADMTNLDGREGVVAARQRGDCVACEYLRYGLAKGLAEYVGSMDEHVRAIYTFDEDEPATRWDDALPNLTPGIRMLIWVERKSPALDTLVEALKTSAEQASRSLGCRKSNALCHQMDVLVVDDQDVQRRIGYGALTGSLYLSPIEIWRR
jgi:hypothetical protein